MTKKSFNAKVAAAVAGVMALTPLALVGCTGNKNRDADATTTVFFHKGVYIVVTENEISTLHEGNVGCRRSFDYSDVSEPYLVLNCGLELPTYQYVPYIQMRPTEDKYDKVCDCAHEWISE